MRMAIDASFTAVREGNMPYGAVLASADGVLVHVSRNNQVTSGDCTGHAETVLIREVCAQYGAGKLAGATVSARVIGEAKGPKIRGFTYKNKSRGRKSWGHRQHYTTIEITGISREV